MVCTVLTCLTHDESLFGACCTCHRSMNTVSDYGARGPCGLMSHLVTTSGVGVGATSRSAGMAGMGGNQQQQQQVSGMIYLVDTCFAALCKC
jgi:hypothetical protein